MTLKQGFYWFMLVVVTTVVSFFALRYLVERQGLAMSIHGEIALALGVFFTMSLGIGLMLLLFHSNRSGHDEQAHQVQETTKGELRSPD